MGAKYNSSGPGHCWLLLLLVSLSRLAKSVVGDVRARDRVELEGPAARRDELVVFFHEVQPHQGATYQAQ